MNLPLPVSPPSGRGVSFISNLFIVLFNFFRSCFNLTWISVTLERYNFSAILSLFFILLSSFLFLSYFLMKSCLSNIFTFFFELFKYSIGICLNHTMVYSDGRMGASKTAGMDFKLTDFQNFLDFWDVQFCKVLMFHFAVII